MSNIKNRFVKVISGSSKNKTGVVFKVIYKANSVTGVLVRGLNLKKKYSKKSFSNPNGSINSVEHSICISNIKVLKK